MAATNTGFKEGQFQRDATTQQISAGASGALSGAAQGFGAGASAGAAGGPQGALIGGVLGAGTGLIAGGLSGGLNARRSSVDKLRDELLERDILDAQEGKLGLSQAEKDTQIADQQQAAMSRVQAQQADISRANMGGQGFTGQFAQLQRNLAGSEVAAGAMASRGVEEASRRQESQRFAQLQNDLLRKSQETAITRAELEEKQRRAGQATMAAAEDFTSQLGGEQMLEGMNAGNDANISFENMSEEQRAALMAELEQYSAADQATGAGFGGVA